MALRQGGCHDNLRSLANMVDRASGEYTWMDHEAAISRTVLLKPLASSLTSYPDIYEEDVTCASVQPDFRNLESVVKGLIADEPKMQRIADTAYQRLLHHVQERCATSSRHAMSASGLSATLRSSVSLIVRVLYFAGDLPTTSGKCC